MPREQTWITGALVLFCLLLCVLALGLSSTAGRLPMWVAMLTLVPIGLQLWKDSSAAEHADPQKRERPVMMSVLALLAALYLVGFLVALPIFAGFYWRRRAGSGWVGALVAAAVVFAALYVGFELLMRVDLHQGALVTWLGG